MRLPVDKSDNAPRRLKSKLNDYTPKILNAAEGDKKGEIHLIWDPVNTAHSYLLQKCSLLKKPYKWKHEDVIKSNNYTVTKLKSNKSYLFRIASISDKGKSGWSLPVTKKAP